ncbi:MAG: hypothetical protein A2600_04965 [Candidatus Lambdaproteobacteria bacterium RIFOXYD1_FULL_56_27]|uniref:Phosphotyrosine protein phosphatase I domain-containing protein n=1 Tax=Candidatus Lambdaproteobacteria bacterium RIFOXYD2_FULL_56_26 TaxID=1817773 RepID=A0A1F6GS55_9PROT|nr:MAG: hypothetical protein A2426_07820 [Candidatus Lambdaproteobacteria bacterium RIFOXYC1_FULL_56_13]OGH00831.1 MAG: hypothetical protein A2557_03920 [Candidatus Lambdaproteobacteria bacterium RIFOXYD2_FULL_56_26]OGH09904.1 MAG: hypothetical protein A2600_04965 [Candidatus Lambdaproteobacteria bacterium RIFOXYD1_FULL_56_27]
MKILVLCSTNSVRSQMAEAFLESLDPRLEVNSAGTRPKASVHPLAIRVMHEKGWSMLGQQTKRVEHFFGQHFDYLITLCQAARNDCLTFPGEVSHRVHFNLADPAQIAGNPEIQLGSFREVRDQLMEFLKNLYAQEMAPKLAAGG